MTSIALKANIINNLLFLDFEEYRLHKGRLIATFKNITAIIVIDAATIGEIIEAHMTPVNA